MNLKTSFWQSIGLHDWFLTKENSTSTLTAPALTPDDVYKFIVEKFEESVTQLSFAGRIVFYHEYIICFNQEDYNDFMAHKKGIFGLIIQESVKRFYAILNEYRQKGKNVEPASNKWVFRFVSHPDYPRGDKSFIGKLLPGGAKKQEENLRVTYIPRQTGIAKTFDINQDILDGFTYYSDGYYELPFQDELLYKEPIITNGETAVLARFEAILPDKEFAGRKLEFYMKHELITVSGIEEQGTQQNVFRLPSDWVNTPHLHIRYQKNDGRFYLASFGEKTIVNETEVLHSREDDPAWTELPLNSKIVLNGIVGINIFKS